MPRISSSTQEFCGEDEDDADDDDGADDTAAPEDPDEDAEGLEAAVAADKPESAPPDEALLSLADEDEEGSLSLFGFLGLLLNFVFLSDA